MATVIDVPVDQERLENSGYEKVAKGRYDIQITEVGQAQNDKIGPQLVIGAQIERAKDAQNAGYVGRAVKFRINLAWTDQLKEFLDATGVDYQTIEQPGGKQAYRLDIDNLVGRYCDGLVVHTTDKHDKTKEYENWRRFQASSLEAERGGGYQAPHMPPAGQPGPHPGVPGYAPPQQAQPGYQQPGQLPPQGPPGVPQGYPQAAPPAAPQGYPQGVPQGVPPQGPPVAPQGYPPAAPQGYPQAAPQGQPAPNGQGYPPGYPQQ